MWIEISIPKTLQMAYSEYQITRHLAYMNNKAKEDVESDEEIEAIELFRLVDS